jgi:hypothetical protein
VRWAPLAIRSGGSADAADSAATESSKRALHPALQGLIAFVIYLGVFILAFCLALVSRLKSPAVGQIEVDPNFYIWAWRWWAYAVAHWTNPLYSYQIGAPAGYSLAWATTAPTVALFMWPVTTLFGAVTSFNVTLLLAPPASAWAAFVLARRLTGRFWASLPAGVVYGFNVYMLDHEVSGQPNLTVTLLIPLMAYLVVLRWEKTLGAVGYVIWMTIVLALEFYTFIEAFAEVTLLWVPAVLVGLALARRGRRRSVLWLTLQTLIAYVGALVLTAPYLYYALKHQPTSFTRQEPQFSLDLSGLVLPRADRLLGMHWWAAAAGHDRSATTYLGFPLLLVLLLFVIFHWRSRLTWLLLAGMIIILGLAAGPNLIVDGKPLFALPWGGLWSLPLAKSAEPIRLVVFVYLILSVMLACWLAALSRSWLLRAARWSLGLLAIAAIFADLPTFAEVVVPPAPRNWEPATSLPATNTIPAFFTDGTYRQYLSPGEIVAVVSRRGNAAMLFQADTNFYFKVDGGFINASLSDVDALPAEFQLMGYPNKERDQEFTNFLRQTQVGAIIVENAWSELWMYNFGALGLNGTSVGGVTVYQTGDLTPVDLSRPGVIPAPTPVWSTG